MLGCEAIWVRASTVPRIYRQFRCSRSQLQYRYLRGNWFLLFMQDTGLVRMRLALLATCFSTVWAGLVPTLRFWTSRT